MKESSILKRLRDTSFAPSIKREDIRYGCEKLGVTLEEHVANIMLSLSPLSTVTR